MRKGKGFVAFMLSVAMVLSLCNSVVFARGNENGNIIQPTQNREYQVKPDADPKEADGGIEDEENNVVQPSVNTQNDVLLLNDAVTPVSVTDEVSFSNAMTSGGEVVLENDITLNNPITIPAGVEVILDLNGKSIIEKGSGSRRIVNNGTLTIRATNGGTIKNENIGSFGLVDNYGILTIAGGTYIDNSVGDGASIKNREGATLTITGGTFQGEAQDFTNPNYSNYWANSRVNNSGTLIISGGTFISNVTSMPVIKQTAGTAVIENATITSQKSAGMEINGGTATLSNNTITVKEANSYYASAVAASGAGQVTIDSGTYVSAGYGVYIWNSGGTITVKDGTIKGEIAAVKADGREGLSVPAAVIVEGGRTEGAWQKNDFANASLTVLGGTHTEDVTEYLAPGCEIAGNQEDGYTVTITYVAEVGGQKYATLAAAIQAADNNIVKLLEDVTLDETLTIEGKTLTLDLNGKIISGSVATNGLINATMGTQLTIMDTSGETVKGTICNTGTSTSRALAVRTGSAIILESGVNIEAKGSSGAASAALYIFTNDTNAPEVIIRDANLSAAKGYPIRFDSSSRAAKLTIEGGDFVMTDKAPTLQLIYNDSVNNTTIKGGTFHNWSTTMDGLLVADGYCVVMQDEGTNGELTGTMVTVQQNEPAVYAAKIEDLNIYYLSFPEDNLFYLLYRGGEGHEYTIMQSASCVYPAGENEGTSTGTPLELTLSLAQGVNLTGSMPVEIIDILVTGEGTVADNFFQSFNTAKYQVMSEQMTNGTLYSGRLKDELVVATVVLADGTEIQYADFDDAVTGANRAEGCVLRLEKDVPALSERLTVSENWTLNLNGHNIVYTGSGPVNPDTTTFGVFTMNTSNITLTVENSKPGEGGVIQSDKKGVFPFIISRANAHDSRLVIGAGITVKGPVLINDFVNATLDIYGTIDTIGTANGGAAIYNNGANTESSTINLYDGAVINSDSHAIYHPGTGTLNVYGASVTGGNVGIEMRAGTLNVYDGAVIIGGSGKPSSNTNGSGTTTNNAAVAIAQHTAGNPVVFNSYGGTYTGGAAVYESNPENNDAAATEKITINIEDGMFDGSVNSTTQEGFISGGTFTEEPANEDIYPGLEAVKEGSNFIVNRLQDVYVSGTSGNDNNNGMDSQNAVKTLEHAMKLVADDGVIYVCGTVTVDGSLTADGMKIERADGFTDTLITVTGTGTELTLVNTTIDGKKAGNRTGNLVSVTGGAMLNIEEGAKLINNNETAVQVNANSMLNMNDGEISGNAASTWGGGIVNNGGIVNLNGGSITRNTAGDVGGGVVIVNGGTTTLNGAAISDNTAARNGGGVYIQGSNASKETIFEMKDGAITANTATGGFGGGIYALYHTGEITVRISGGSITDNVIRMSGAAIGLEGENGIYPTMELSGSPNISGDVFLYDKEAGPVVHVTGAFTPAEPVELSVNRGAEGTVAVAYENGIEPDTTQFVSENETIGLKQDGQNLVWAKMLKISFKTEDNKSTYKTVYVLKNTTIDAGLAPTPTETGYTLDGWRRYGVEEAWDFAADTVTGNMTLLAIWSLNAPDVEVSADVNNPHEGTNAILTATPLHDLANLTYIYQWHKDGEPLTGENGNQLTVSETGKYTVKVMAFDGSKTSAEVESEPVEITVDGHVYVPVVTKPTCTEQGYTTYTCKICGDTYVDSYTEPTGHSLAARWSFDADSHWKECVECGKIFKQAVHTFEWVTDKEATATEAGSKHEECTVCGFAKAAVDIPSTNVTEEPPINDNTPDGEDQTGDKNIPQTGDNSNVGLWIAVMLAAGTALTCIALYSRKKKYSR